MRENKVKKLSWLIGCAVLAGQMSWAAGVYKPAGTVLRIGSYNVCQSRIYKGNDNTAIGSRYDAWPRVMNGTKADVWLLQEMFYGEDPVPNSYIEEFAARVRSVTGDSSWKWAADNEGRVTLSRYPIIWSAAVSHRIHATWIDLPSTVSSKDLLVINVHFMTLDQSVIARDFIRQVRAGTTSAKIPSDISIVFGGDFNALPGSTRYNNIKNEGFTDMDPAHNGTSERNTIGAVSLKNNSYLSPIGRNHLDFVLLESETLFKANSFILNTIIMPSADRTAFGFQQRDIAVDANKTTLDFVNGTIECDHFPSIVDLRGPLYPNGSAFVSQSVPATLTVGQTANVSITLKNTGTDIWSTAAGHRLGTQNPRDNKVWAGTNRVALAQNVAPNANYTFTISIKAPATPGVYNFQWQMVDDAGANIGWFGALTPNVAINVTAPNKAPYFSVNPFSMPNATNGLSYSQSISTKAVDPEGGTKTFSKVAGPVWLSVSSTGAIQGTPATVDVGTNSFSVKVTDNGGLSATATMKIIVVKPLQTVSFTSIAAEDGYINESSETSNIGGSVNATGKQGGGVRIGDTTTKQQNKSILSFDTSSIPDTAVIQSANLKLIRGDLTGTVTNLGLIKIDIKGGTGFNGSTALQKEDFQAAADAAGVATMSFPSANGVLSTGSLNATGLSKVNKTGKTQLRLYFTTDDDNDGTSDYLGFYPAENATAANRPVLVITYQ